MNIKLKRGRTTKGKGRNPLIVNVPSADGTFVMNAGNVSVVTSDLRKHAEDTDDSSIIVSHRP